MFKVGIIGPKDLVEQSFAIAQEYKGVEPIKLFYSNEEQTVELIKNNDSMVDGFLFTGFLPYYETQRSGITKKRLFYYPILGASLYHILFIMKVHEGVDITRISIDTLNSDEIKEVYEEIKLPDEKLYINERGLTQFSREQYIDFHRLLYKSGKTVAAVTAVNSVYERLKEESVPVFRVIPTIYTMRETFKLIEASGLAHIAENNQIIIQIIDIKDYNINGSRLSTVEMRQKKLALYQELLNYARNYMASVFPAEGDEFIILITKGLFREYTNFYEEIPMIYDIEKKLSMAVNMGIGMGKSAMEAEENAREALLLSKKKPGSNAYIINQDKKVIGPIGNGGILDFALKSDDKNMLKWAEKTGLSISTLTQIESLLKKLQRDSITATDIQEGLGVTLRTANRIMKKLLSGQAAEKMGIEQPVYRGRPRQLYRIRLKDGA
ncbi:MAG TPA: hypothetical protein GXX35_13780 [Thermoanaerobacterales bacterium]|nr:hypothetical protein [Thermoanaerobacterales bacterium]